MSWVLQKTDMIVRYASVFQRFASGYPTVIERLSSCYPTFIQRLSNLYPTVIQRYPNGFITGTVIHQKMRPIPTSGDASRCVPLLKKCLVGRILIADSHEKREMTLTHHICAAFAYVIALRLLFVFFFFFSESAQTSVPAVVAFEVVPEHVPERVRRRK